MKASSHWSIFVLGFFFASITSLLPACRINKKSNTKSRPNIIVILVDDMGFSDIGCYGSEIETPAIDQLGFNGLRFTQFYNAARCCPSRAALLTGLYPHEAGMGDMVEVAGRSRETGPYQGWLSQHAVTIAEVLKENGYATYMSGKWHVGEDSLDWPLTRGFSKYFGLISGANSYFEILPGRKMVSQNKALTQLPENFYMTDAITDSALNFVNQGEKKKPFFLYVAYTAPHWPMQAKDHHIKKYRGWYNVGWDSIRQKRYHRQQKLGLFPHPVNLSPRDESIPPWDNAKDQDEWSLKMSVYAAMMESVDENVGKITYYLAKTGQLDNTLIMFLSDNGGCHETLDGRLDRDLLGAASLAKSTPTGKKGSYTTYGKEWANTSNTPFRLYKHWTHEGGISTPFIIHYPTLIKKGKTVHESAHLIDILPTILDLTGSSYPKSYHGFEIQPAEGTSLVPLMTDQAWGGHEYLFWEHEGSRAVRQGKWKLVSMPNRDWELYDLETDRSELKNLSKIFPDKVKSMEQAYQAWASRVGVKP